MTEIERQVNRNLRVLDEAHRLGRIGRDEYRGRRRQLLGSMNESNVITARNALTSTTATTERPGPPPKRSHSQRRGRDDALTPMFAGHGISRWWFYVLAFVAAAAVFGLLLYLFAGGG